MCSTLFPSIHSILLSMIFKGEFAIIACGGRYRRNIARATLTAKCCDTSRAELIERLAAQNVLNSPSVCPSFACRTTNFLLVRAGRISRGASPRVCPGFSRLL